MLDYLGKKMKVGDKVVMLETYGRSSNLTKATITGFSNTFVVTDHGKKSPSKCIKIDW